MVVKFYLGPNAKMPEHANERDAGYDVFYAESFVVNMLPGMRHVFNTNLSWQPYFNDPEEKILFDKLHMGVYIDVRDRSGMSAKRGLLKMAGVIDEPYRGNIGIVLVNTNTEDEIVIKPGDKIAQIIFSPCLFPTSIIQAKSLDETTRGSDGFGSTGM